MVIILVWLPLIVTFVGGTQIFYDVLLKKSESLHVCRKSLLQYQNALQQGLNNLLKLNPRAKSLRVLRAQADIAVKAAAGNPYTLAAAKAYQLYIVYLQRSLYSQQMSIIMATETQNAVVLATAIANLNNLPYVEKVRSLGGTSLAVYKTPKRSQSPDYKTRSHYSRKQNISMKWNIAVNNTSPFFSLMSPAFSFECSATQVQKELQWQSQLSQRDKL